MSDHRDHVTGESKPKRGHHLKIAWRVAAVCVTAAICLMPSVLYAPVGLWRFVIGALSIIYGSVAVLFVGAALSDAYGFGRAPYPTDVRLRLVMAFVPFVVVVCVMGLQWALGNWNSFDVGGAFAAGGVFASPFALSALWGVLASTLPTRTMCRVEADVAPDEPDAHYRDPMLPGQRLDRPMGPSRA